MKRYDRLIFVSTSDTAVGPMAEAVLQSKFLLEELSITSKGLVVLFPEPINPKAEAVLASKGLSMKDHVSEPLEKEDFNDRTLMLTLDEAVRQKVLAEFNPEHKELVRVLTEFVGIEGELINPYGGSLADYGLCYEGLEVLISRLVVQLNEEELLC